MVYIYIYIYIYIYMNECLDTKITLNVLYCVHKNIKITKYTTTTNI